MEGAPQARHEAAPVFGTIPPVSWIASQVLHRAGRRLMQII